MNSFLQGKKTFSGPPLRPVTAGVKPSVAPASVAHSAADKSCGTGQPTVEVIKEGDKVVRLIVVCSCGERVEIDCLYPAG